jgi:hypothetical protein
LQKVRTLCVTQRVGVLSVPQPLDRLVRVDVRAGDERKRAVEHRRCDARQHHLGRRINTKKRQLGVRPMLAVPQSGNAINLLVTGPRQQSCQERSEPELIEVQNRTPIIAEWQPYSSKDQRGTQYAGRRAEPDQLHGLADCVKDDGFEFLLAR